MAQTIVHRARPEPSGGGARRGSMGRFSAALVATVMISLVVPAQARAGAVDAVGHLAAPCEETVLDDPTGGAQAVRELGSDLPAAAALVDKTPTQLRTLLRSDPTVRVDECGATFVVEPDRGLPAAAEAGAGATAGDAGPLVGEGIDVTGDPFALSSRLGSSRTVYLDFTGSRIVGTSWNTLAGVADFTAPPFDLDGAPGTFSAAEGDIVRGVWARVSEDFAPFDVNVTTADPGPDAITRSGAGDLVFGTRALITGDNVVYANVCDRQCGGIAYLNVFDRSTGHALTQPALIFHEALQSTAKSIGEAVSHEVGHNLGLGHDGTATSGYYSGHSPWAPIMGVGYYQPVSQWSNGEYGGSNHEDDLAVIAGHGLAVRADDHPDTPTGAASLALGTVTPRTAGLIATRDDVDVFTFSVLPGVVSTGVTVTPSAVGANLDVRLRIFDAAGALVTVADPAPARVSRELVTGMGAAVGLPLAPGTYVAAVDGVGFGTPQAGYSDYASLGHYTIGVAGATEPLVVTTTELPRATAGVAYSAGLAGAGGTAPHTWSLVSAPVWLRVSAGGVLSGTPPEQHTYPVTIRVADHVGFAATTTLTVTVDAAPVTPTPLGPPPPEPTAPPTAPPTGPRAAPPTGPVTRPIPVLYRAALRTAVAQLPVRAESGAGFRTARFPQVDADGDCRSTRTEVLLAESRHRPEFTTSRRCTVRAGRWYSSFDRRTVTAGAKVTATYAVPLAEAWESGARSWTPARRIAYANDLGESRTLVAVSAASARARGSQEPTRWLPLKASQCSYLASWVAVKARWGLSVDAGEKRRLRSLASGCADVALGVHRA